MTEQPQNILQLIPPDQWDRVMNQDMCDIEPVFMGFMDIYEPLSKMIPKRFTVVDFGAAYNPQCFYFRDHKKYIAVEPSVCEMFQSENCEIFRGTIKKWISEKLHTVFTEETFAICSYVPSDEKEFIAQHFENLFMYYPHGGYDEFNKLIADRIGTVKTSVATGDAILTDDHKQK